MTRARPSDDTLGALNPGGERRRRRRARIRRAASIILHHRVIRWLIAYLVPLVLLASAALMWVWFGFLAVGYYGLGVVGIALAGAYLVKVQGTHLVWLIPLVAFFLPTYFLFFAVPNVILAHTGREITAVLPYDSFQGTDFFHTWQCYVELPGGAPVPSPNDDPIRGCHERQGQHVKLIADTRGKVPPILASERNQWIVPMVSGGGGMLLLLLTVTGAIINGERWIRRNERQLPVGWAESLRRPRGSSAYLWVR